MVFFCFILFIILLAKVSCVRRDENEVINHDNKFYINKDYKCYLYAFKKEASGMVQPEYKLPARLEVCIYHYNIHIFAGILNNI